LYAPRPGALPARFRRERVLLVGCGDVGVRVAALMQGRVCLLALTSSAGRVAELRAKGVTPLQGNLDQPASLARLSGLATRVVHLAPPPEAGRGDPRTLALIRTLRQRALPQSLVYGSTSGVYGATAKVKLLQKQELLTPIQQGLESELMLKVWCVSLAALRAW